MICTLRQNSTIKYTAKYNNKIIKRKLKDGTIILQGHHRNKAIHQIKEIKQAQ